MITIEEIKKSQKSWGEGIVSLGKCKDNTNRSVEEVNKFIKSHYGFEQGNVLFKPTKPSINPFRNTKKSAISYFIGKDPDFPNDSGFALNPWKDVKFDNKGYIIEKDFAIAMGEYYFIDQQDQETKVEYTFGYKKHPNTPNLIIQLHHSSLPFSYKQ
jgi:hypothetical protein